jgi:hypothetical protein
MTHNSTEVIDVVEPSPDAVVIHKQVWEDQEFRDRRFYGLPRDRQARDHDQLWLESQFGSAEPQRTWWISAGRVFMNSQIYTWYCLAHGMRS